MDRDSVFAIGLKSVGSARGVVRGKPQLTRQEWTSAAIAVVNQFGVHVVQVDTVHLPVIRVRLANIAVMAAIRHLPFVDFVEPAKIRLTYAGGCDDWSGGSSNGSSGSDSPYGEQLVPVYTSSGGIDYIAHTVADMGVPNAWLYANGRGVTVGITDTGLDLSPPSQFSSGYFTAGDSYGRTLSYFNFMGGQAPVCSHGTRIAGLVAAPRDGNSVVGAAYAANVSAGYQSDGENPDVTDAANAIHAVVTSGGAKVVVMAWGEFNWYDNISNEIDAHYYNDDVFFVGAAGTCPIGSWCPRTGSAIFPAEKGEVLAVTGANSDGTQPDNIYDYGSKIEGILGYTNLATTGLNTSTIVNIAGSSGATGSLGGIAALVRSAFPWANNATVMSKLLSTDGDQCRQPPPQWRNSMVNAFAAVGGLCVPPINGSAAVGPLYLPDDQATYHYSIAPRGGSGSYSYNWVPGGPQSASPAEDIVFFASGYGDQSYTRRITVTVTDNVTGIAVSRWLDVYVNVQPDPNGGCGGSIRC